MIMKNLVLIIGGILLLLNFILGVIFSVYKPFNIGLNSAVIFLNTLLLYILGVSKIKDGFKISLSFLFLIAAIIEFRWALFIPSMLENNIALAMLILLFVGQLILFTICYFVSKVS